MTAARAAGRPKASPKGVRLAPRPASGRKEYLFAIQEKAGTVQVSGPRGFPVLPRLWAGVELAQGEVFTTCQGGLSAGDGAWVSEVANGRLVIGLSLKRSTAPAGALLQVSVLNRGPDALAIRQIRVAHAVTGTDAMPWGPASGWTLLRMGYAPGVAHREDADSRGSSRVAFADDRVVARSWGAAALRFGASARGLVAGFVTAGAQMGWIDVRRDRHTIEIAAVCETDGLLLPAGRRLVSETLYLGVHDDVRTGLAEYAGLCGRRAGVSPRPVPTGWSTGGTLAAGDLTAAAVQAQARSIASRRRELPLAVFRIDEGWAAACGDWTAPADRFPDGLRPVAAAIAEAGFVPGISLAPFAASASSAVFRAHPDWMVKDDAGKPLPWETEGGETAEPWYGLDGSHPEVQDHLRELFASLRRAGFRHVKLDALFMGCLKGRHAQPVTRARAYRMGLEAIRAGAGDAYLLGSAGPFPPAAGIADGMRVCRDIPAEFGTGVPEALGEARQRWWAHRALWNNDPGPITAGAAGSAGAEEAGTVAASAEMSGGAIFAAGPVDGFAPDRIAILRGAIARRRDAAAVPLDVFDRDVPRILSLPAGRHRFRVAVFNDTGSPRVFALDLEWFGCARARVWEMNGDTRGSMVIARRRCMTPPVPAHGVRVILIERA